MRRWLVISLLVAGAWTTPLSAQPRNDPESQTDREQPATPLTVIQVTATRRAESRLDAPVATTVLTREQLLERPAATVMQALHGEAGTFVQQTTPGQAIVIVRGLKGSEVLHLVDGFRLNNAIFRNAPNQYMALVDGQMLDAIEVVRGPMSALYGGDAMGGVVQLRTWDPRFDGERRGYQGSLRTLWSSADRGLLSRVEGAAGDQRFALSGGLTYQDVGELRSGGGERLAFSGFRAQGGNLKLTAQLGDNQQLLLQSQYFEQPSTPRHDELVPGFNQTNPGSAEFAFEPQARRFHQAQWTLSEPTALFDQLVLMGGRQSIRDDRRNRDFGSLNRDLERNTVTTDGFSVIADRAWRENRYLTYGVEWYRDHVASFRQRVNAASGAISPRPARFPDGSTMRQLGAFVQEDWQLTPSLDVLYGVRLSDVRTTLAPTGGVPGVTVDNQDLSGNLGLNFALREELRLVANVGRAFRAPNVFDLGVFGDRPGNRFQRPNPALEPETVLSVDAGVKFSGAEWSGELIGFRSNYRNKIVAVVTGEQTPSGRLVVESRNATRQTLTGLETRLDWRPAERLRGYATATWTRGDEILDGLRDPADRIPPLYGKAGVAWDLRADLALEGYAFYATRQARLSTRDRNDPRINPDGTAGWATLNLRLGWRPIDALEFGLRLENLADQRYREHGSGIDQRGRNAMVSVDWRF